MRAPLAGRRALRILLVAYEYPPSPSPQSLRWMYLTQELSGLGHDIHVLTPEIGMPASGLAVPERVRVWRTFAGPLRGGLAWLANRKKMETGRPTQGSDSRGAAASRGSAINPSLNWKGKLLACLQSSMEYLLFPDARGEWKCSATKGLSRVLKEVEPDVVISSHEPATSIELGLLAKRRGFKWIADLGDPIVAQYTPPRWIKRSRNLEGATARSADGIVVTTDNAAACLRQRYDLPPARVEVITQGFDHRLAPGPPLKRPSHGAPWELLYTGSFYSFRRAEELINAVLASGDVRLNIASMSVPEYVKAAAAERPSSIRLLGFLKHSDALRWQRYCHVLINISNGGDSQVPGKFYEYLGAQRPILHIGEAGRDLVAKEIERMSLGWVVCNETRDIMQLLSDLGSRVEEYTLQAPGRSQFSERSWAALAQAYENVIRDVVQ